MLDDESSTSITEMHCDVLFHPNGLSPQLLHTWISRNFKAVYSGFSSVDAFRDLMAPPASRLSPLFSDISWKLHVLRKRENKRPVKPFVIKTKVLSSTHHRYEDRQRADRLDCPFLAVLRTSIRYRETRKQWMILLLILASLVVLF